MELLSGVLSRVARSSVINDVVGRWGKVPVCNGMKNSNTATATTTPQRESCQGVATTLREASSARPLPRGGVPGSGP